LEKPPTFPNPKVFPCPIFSYNLFNSSFEGKNQSLNPPSIKVSQRYAAIQVSEQSASISAVFCFPVPISVPSAPEIRVPEQPHFAPPWSVGEAIRPVPFKVSK
jgi:hypothetical protein